MQKYNDLSKREVRAPGWLSRLSKQEVYFSLMKIAQSWAVQGWHNGFVILNAWFLSLESRLVIIILSEGKVK